jgi:UDP-N-acetylglucosamine diphosphorylase/glucosamine-1-phosphate N-acetyltransferase
MFVLFDNPEIRQQLLPLTFTRPIADLRVGILTIAEKWEKYLKDSCFHDTALHLHALFGHEIPEEMTLFVNGAICPTNELANQVAFLKNNEALISPENELIAIRTHSTQFTSFFNANQTAKNHVFQGKITWIKNTWDIFLQNGAEIKNDFELITHNRVSQPITDQFCSVYSPENIFVEEGAVIKAAVLNASSGVIYIGKNTEIQEGALIRGNFALCEGAVVNMGAKIRGDTTIGPYSKVGGEISNSVIWGYSNKGHDGFLGNSVIGAWCNLGAGTNTSNLKNNYGSVKVWSYVYNDYEDTSLQFCGLTMGDHSKAGINTMFNTGTVVGVGTNVFGGGFPPKHIPSFAWLEVGKPHIYQELGRFLEAEKRVMERRRIEMSVDYRNMLVDLYSKSK